MGIARVTVLLLWMLLWPLETMMLRALSVVALIQISRISMISILVRFSRSSKDRVC
jgi:hypothetical protein